MPNFSALLDSIVTLGKAVLPMIVPGAAGAIEAAERMIEMIDHAKDALTDTDADVSALEETRAEFEARINAMVDDTVNRLRGEDESE